LDAETGPGATVMDIGASTLQAACRATVVLGVCFVSLLAGCTAGDVALYEPEGSGLARGLTVKVEPDSTAADIADALGWTDGVPDAEVLVQRIGTEFRWGTALTDPNGLAGFADLIQGTYRLAAYRVLTDDETAQLGRRQAFADGTKVYLSQPLTWTLRMAAEQPRSLVFSEVYGTAPFVSEIQYAYHMFLELYNNSDTLVFLDGMIVGFVPIGPYPSELFPCEASAPFRNDPDGIWALFFHQFPGAGAEYPLAPGRTVVVALDAVDHSAVDPRFPDLSHADFEFLGSADVDNPAVPNMPEVGLESWREGHGLKFYVGSTFFLSRRVDPDALVRRQIWEHGEEELVRFPSEAILDVLATVDDDAMGEQGPMCDEKTHRNFDRLEGGGIKHGVDLEYSVQRRVIDYTPGGRAILQDTNTSAVDLVRALYTPGTLPQPQLGGARSAAGTREH
jgi:hypothetical protein